MTGRFEMIVGSMFSGKTEELMRRVRRYAVLRKSNQIFKPYLDTRHDNEIGSHAGWRTPAREIETAANLVELATPFEIVGIDEVQFVKGELVAAIENLLADGKIVIAAGLDKDWRGRAFSPTIGELMAISDDLVKLQAVCVRCGQPATMTHRKSHSIELIEIGAGEAYEARCRACWIDGMSATHSA